MVLGVIPILDRCVVEVDGVLCGHLRGPDVPNVKDGLGGRGECIGGCDYLVSRPQTDGSCGKGREQLCRELVATVGAVPTNSAKSSSNRSTRDPVVIQTERKTSDTSSISC